MIETSLRQVGAARSGVIDENGVILAGNGTYEALAAAGIEKVKVVEADGNEWVVVQRKGLSEEQKRLLALADNRAAELAEWDGPALAAQGIDLAPWFNTAELAKIGAGSSDVGQDGPTVEAARQTLRERFLIPPFSVLDARQGYWQDRKRAWLALGIQSEIGRGGGINNQSEMALRLAGGFENHPAHKAKLSPGGSPRPAMKLKDGHTVRGDGKGRAM